MILTALKGGLGNQLFQYALGRRVAIDRNDILVLDTTGLARANEVGDIYRPFALDAFKIQASVADQKMVIQYKYPYGFISKALRWFCFRVLKKTYVGWEPKILQRKENVYFDGYWQSPKYFDSIRSTLLDELVLTSPLSEYAANIKKKIIESNSVSVHIRRGDYVSNEKTKNVHGPCSVEYYLLATAEISKQITVPKWFIFSDDIEWVEKNITLPGETVYVSGGTITDAQEIVLMSTCKHNIIANSTFSWWGAWLNKNQKKMVIAPTPWFDSKKNNHKDLIPESWILLPKY